MNYTTNFNLRLPERNEQFNLDDWNNNTKSIDSAMQTNKTNISNNATNITSILTGLSTVDTDTSSIYYKLMKLIYPVGSLYWSSKSTNPSSLFGGTWVQIKDRFVLACGDTYTSVDETGGESSVTLSVSNMPSHTHSFTPSGSISSHSHSFTPSGDISDTTATGTVSNHTHSFSWSGSHSHNTLGIGGRSETDEDFGGGIDCNRGYGSNKVATSSTTITVKADTTSTMPTFTGILGITKDTQPTFTGTGGTTGNATATGSVSSHSHSLSLTTSGTGTSAGGTHGKLLGMNYIIKT